MGKKGSWISAVKKALSPQHKKKKDKKTHRLNSKLSEEERDTDRGPFYEEIALPSPTEDKKYKEAENKHNKHAYSLALATAAAAEAAVVAAQAAAEVVRLTTVARQSGKSHEEEAAIKIQTAFRGYLARRALRALKGLVRLKSMIQGQSVKRQAKTTLRWMQTLARVQSQIRARRVKMSEENEALHRQLEQKCEKELDKLRASVGKDWNDSAQSKEQIEAKLQSKQEAAIRRERALAYAHSHQRTRNNSSKSGNSAFSDPISPHWGWSWLERWMAARPWENRVGHENELNSDRASVKSATSHAVSLSHLSKFNSPRDQNHSIVKRPIHPHSRQSPSTQPITTKTSFKGTGYGGGKDDDLKSAVSSLKSEKTRNRRHSIAGSSVRDDESLASSVGVPSYMAPTHSAKAKSRLQSPCGNHGTSENGSVSSAKKRLSFSPSPSGRRQSSPANLDPGSVKASKCI